MNSSMYMRSSNSGVGGIGSSGSGGVSGDCAVAATGSNNSMAISEISESGGRYQAPGKPKMVAAYQPLDLLAAAVEFREAIRGEDRSFVQLWFRVRRMNYEQLLWQLISTGYFRRDQSYDPANLPYWTIGMRVKIRSQLTMGRVMAAIRCRLGNKCPGLRFCLDGFFGMRGYSDIFSNTDACPWMEISNFSTVLSLRLKHGDSVYISVASPAQIADVIQWRRARAMTMPTGPDRQQQQHEQDTKEDHGTVIGKIAYNSQVMDDLM